MLVGMRVPSGRFGCGARLLVYIRIEDFWVHVLGFLCVPPGANWGGFAWNTAAGVSLRGGRARASLIMCGQSGRANIRGCFAMLRGAISGSRLYLSRPVELAGHWTLGCLGPFVLWLDPRRGVWEDVAVCRGTPRGDPGCGLTLLAGSRIVLASAFVSASGIASLVRSVDCLVGRWVVGSEGGMGGSWFRRLGWSCWGAGGAVLWVGD